MTAPALTSRLPRLAAEEIRTKVGFSRAQWSRLNESDYPLLTLSQSYDLFLRHLLANIDLEFKHPAFVVDDVGYLTTVGVSHALGIGEFLIANLRNRGKLSSEQKVGRRAVYSRADLVEFVTTASSQDRRSALATAFVRWLRQRDPVFPLSEAT